MGKALVTLLEEHPRDELLQISEDELFETAMGILRLVERQRTRLFVRRDAYGRYLSCLIYLPREHHSTELSKRMEQILVKAFNGLSSEHIVHLSESPLARVQIIVRTKPGSVSEFDVRQMKTRSSTRLATGRTICMTRSSPTSARSEATSCTSASETLFRPAIARTVLLPKP
jgi:glutamate dehydrogenase